MMIREPKCVRWKREGAAKITARLSGLTLEEELAFWQQQTAQLKADQAEMHKNQPEPQTETQQT